MEYKNDNRTPRDRITGEFLSELLFTESGGECDCNHTGGHRKNYSSTMPASSVRNTHSASYCNTTDDRNCRNSRPQPHCSNVRRGGKIEISGDYSLAMAYVPMQQFGDLFDMEEGFCEGTIFRSLRFPFYPTPCRKGADC